MLASHILENCGKPSTLFFIENLLLHFLPLYLNQHTLALSHPSLPIKSLTCTLLSPLKSVSCPPLILILLLHESRSIRFVLVINDEILKLINQSQDKQCDFDPI